MLFSFIYLFSQLFYSLTCFIFCSLDLFCFTFCLVFFPPKQIWLLLCRDVYKERRNIIDLFCPNILFYFTYNYYFYESIYDSIYHSTI